MVDSRPVAGGIRRRRECETCRRRFTTHERIFVAPIRVVKAGGRPVEDFDADKLMRSLARVCRRLNVPHWKLEDLVRSIELALVESGKQSVSSRDLAEVVQESLRLLNEKAYLRFLCNYDDRGASIDIEADISNDVGVVQYELFSLASKR